MTESTVLKPHDESCAEIAAWRGRCLDLFARGERAVSGALEAFRASDPSIKMKHLASQRFSDLTTLTTAAELTIKQRQSVHKAITEWATVEARRRHFAHGVVVPLLDRHGSWHARLDFTAYRGNKAEACHWTVSRDEAEDFEGQLTDAFKSLSTQLGNLKKLRR